MSFKTIRTEDADLSRVQQNIAAAFAEPGETAADNFVTTRATQYRINGEETHVFVDGSSNPVVIVLPASGRAPVIKRIDSSAQSVNVQSSDRTLIDGKAQLPLAALSAVQLVFDGRAWWSI